jgi:dihydrofolate reductase
MANYVYIATSLDGFIATKDGGIEWLNEIPNPDNGIDLLNDIPNPDQTDYGYSDFMENIDAIVMGRNTYEKILSFGKWPYNKPVFVLSNSLTDVPDSLKDKVEIVKGEIKSIIQFLDKRGYHNLYVDGGKAIQSFLQEDMIDEMIITRLPILLGDGIPLFGESQKTLKFRHVETDVYNNHLVKSHYIRER